MDAREPATTRREFLLMAGAAGAAASLVTPSKMFAAVGVVKPEKILIPAGAHPAVASAARILAKKLTLDESAIATYDGAPKAAAGAIVLALSRPRSKSETWAPMLCCWRTCRRWTDIR